MIYKKKIKNIELWCSRTSEARTMYFSVIIFKYFLEAQILNIHDLNANLNYLSSTCKKYSVTNFFAILHTGI
jgi:hypothetical protein